MIDFSCFTLDDTTVSTPTVWDVELGKVYVIFVIQPSFQFVK